MIKIIALLIRSDFNKVLMNQGKNSRILEMTTPPKKKKKKCGPLIVGFYLSYVDIKVEDGDSDEIVLVVLAVPSYPRE